MKKIRIVLIALIIVILFGLSFISINSSIRNKPYKNLEKEIVNGMKMYYGQDSNLKKLPKYKDTHKVTLAELEAFGVNINNIVNNDKCDGYGIVTGEKVSHSYKSYIKCKNYQTKNY